MAARREQGTLALCYRRKDRAGLWGKTGSIFKGCIGLLWQQEFQPPPRAPPTPPCHPLQSPTLHHAAASCLTLGLKGRGKNVQLIFPQRAFSFRSGKQMRTALITAYGYRHQKPTPAVERFRLSQLVGPTGTGSPQRGKPIWCVPRGQPQGS